MTKVQLNVTYLVNKEMKVQRLVEARELYVNVRARIRAHLDACTYVATVLVPFILGDC